MIEADILEEEISSTNIILLLIVEAHILEEEISSTHITLLLIFSTFKLDIEERSIAEKLLKSNLPPLVRPQMISYMFGISYNLILVMILFSIPLPALLCQNVLLFVLGEHHIYKIIPIYFLTKCSLYMRPQSFSNLMINFLFY